MPGKIVYLIKLYFLNTGYAGSLCCLRTCFGYRRSYSLIECLRNDILRRKLLVCDQICKSLGSCDLHLIIDVRSPDIQCAAKDSWEAEYIVYHDERDRDWRRMV